MSGIRRFITGRATPAPSRKEIARPVSVDAAFDALPPALIATLARLHAAPEGIPQITFQTLPIGSRTALLSLGLAVEVEVIDESGRRSLVPTSLAYEVMAEADLRTRRPDLAVSRAELEERVYGLIHGSKSGRRDANSAPSHPLVTTDWLESHLDDDSIRVIEVDEDTDAYEKGHIQRAIAWDWISDLRAPVGRQFIDREGLTRLLQRAGVDESTTLVLYGGNNNWFAAYAYWLLKHLGMANVSLLDGGRKKWELESRELTQDVPQFRASDLHLEGPSRPDIRAFRGEVLASLGQSDVCFVDVRSAEEYSGRKLAPDHLPQEQSQVPGHIPGAKNIPWARAATDDGSFKSAEELRALYEDSGITADKEVIAYCRIGERSAHTWFALHELLGYPTVKNYDGSWTEYGSLVGVPVEVGET